MNIILAIINSVCVIYLCIMWYKIGYDNAKKFKFNSRWYIKNLTITNKELLFVIFDDDKYYNVLYKMAKRILKNGKQKKKVNILKLLYSWGEHILSVILIFIMFIIGLLATAFCFIKSLLIRRK